VRQAPGASAERSRGLDLGADDLLSLPFDSRELLSRVRSEQTARGTSFGLPKGIEALLSKLFVARPRRDDDARLRGPAAAVDRLLDAVVADIGRPSQSPPFFIHRCYAGSVLTSTEHRGTADGKPVHIFLSDVSVKLTGSDTWMKAE
jgi:hypothetical protein